MIQSYKNELRHLDPMVSLVSRDKVGNINLNSFYHNKWELPVSCFWAAGSYRLWVYLVEK